MRNSLFKTIGISYDDGITNSSTTSDTAYANTELPYGTMPKEVASGK